MAQTQDTPLLGPFRPPLPGQRAKRGQCELGSEQAFGTGAHLASADSSGPGSQGAGSFDKGFSSRHTRAGSPSGVYQAPPLGGDSPYPKAATCPNSPLLPSFFATNVIPSQWNNRIFLFFIFLGTGAGGRGGITYLLFFFMQRRS